MRITLMSTRRGIIQRQTKRVVNHLLRRGGWGKYVIDCRYHPCIVTKVDYYHNDMWGAGCDTKSLITGTMFCCSYLHCGIEPISKLLAEEMASFAKANTWDDYLKKYHGFTDEDLIEFVKQDDEWDFEKTEPRAS